MALLSRFFSLAEFTASDTAQRENIANEPSADEVARLDALCTGVLDPLRDSIAMAIKVNSGYRSPALNKRVGGAPDSQHVRGEAADIQSSGMSVLDLFKSVVRLGLPFDQLIYEARSATAKWVHVSHRTAGNRGQIMVADFGPDGRPRGYPSVTAQQALDMSEPATRSGRGAIELEYFELGDEPEAPVPAIEPVRETVPEAVPVSGVPAPRAPARKPPVKATKKAVKKKTKAAKKTPKKASAKAPKKPAKKTPKKSGSRKPAATRKTAKGRKASK
jgi:zinc D-Ala-D-Ala carboxypeptidase